MAPSHDPEFHQSFNLGTFSRPNATKHEGTSRWLDRSLELAYSSNYKEATNLFRFCHFL